MWATQARGNGVKKTKIATATELPAGLLGDIHSLIAETRRQTVAAVNVGLTLLYWRIGQRIRSEVLGEKRADYGAEIVISLSRQLTSGYGRTFGEKNLRHMMRFAESFPDEAIVSTLSRQLGWSHFLEILYLKDAIKRDFYAEMCRIERWSVRTLRERIGSMLFERTALSKKPDELIKQELAAMRTTGDISLPFVLKDPYVLDFLGLQDRYLEKDLEDAILRELENFILELGTGFSFIARQKRIQLDNDDFYIDLLFYNRKLKRLVAIDLKLGDFKAEYKGQMELYLRWLDRHEREADEQSPLGIILCTGKKQEQIELLELDKTGIHVAEYLTVLPPREEFEQRLHLAITQSRVRFENRVDET